MTSTTKPIDIPLGRVELLGQVLHIVQHDGRLVAACNDERGMPFEAIVSPRLDGQGCRALMREAVDLLIEAADLSLILSAFAANHIPRLRRCSPGNVKNRDPVCSDGSLVPLNAIDPHA